MKQKAVKALTKRIKITKNGKILKRRAGQDHFNTRASGKITRKKRRDATLSETHGAAIKSMIPGHK